MSPSLFCLCPYISLCICFSVSVYLCVCVCLSLWLCLSVYFCLSASLSLCLSLSLFCLCQSISLCVSVSLSLSVYLSLSVCLSFLWLCLSVYLCLSASQSLCLCVSLSLFVGGVLPLPEEQSSGALPLPLSWEYEKLAISRAWQLILHPKTTQLWTVLERLLCQTSTARAWASQRLWTPDLGPVQAWETASSVSLLALVINQPREGLRLETSHSTRLTLPPWRGKPPVLDQSLATRDTWLDHTQKSGWLGKSPSQKHWDLTYLLMCFQALGHA